MKLTIFAVVAISSIVACGGEKADPRTRTFVDPVRVVWTSDMGESSSPSSRVEAAETLLRPKFGQAPEGGWMRNSAKSACKLVNKGRPSGILLDFGKELHGGLNIQCSRRDWNSKALLRVRFGESVSEAMGELGGKRNATNNHAIRDDVIEVPSFGAREIGNTGFRFVRIDLVNEGSVGLEAVRAVSLMRPMERKGSFRCSDGRINQIYETAVRTVHLCCQDYLWDGIKRDRLVWSGDIHPETMAILCSFGDAQVIPEALDYLAATTPPGTWMNTMPCYTFWWIRNVAEWYRYTGDGSYLRKHALYISETIEHLASCMTPSNTWNAAGFLDWPTKGNPAAENSGKHALAKISFDEAKFLADALGEKELAAKCGEISARLLSLKLEPFGAKTTAALLALSGHRPAKEMFDGVLGRNGHEGVSTFYGYYMLEAMSAAGENKRALSTIRDYWGAMLDMGATSFWEDFAISWTNGCCRIDELPAKGMQDVHGDRGAYCYIGFRHSLCHGWSAGPAAWLMANVLGVKVVESGCRTVEVKPDLCGLDWAEGEFPTPLGNISIKLRKRADGSTETCVKAPDGVKVLRK
jgi:hypothetical protein